MHIKGIETMLVITLFVSNKWTNKKAGLWWRKLIHVNMISFTTAERGKRNVLFMSRVPFSSERKIYTNVRVKRKDVRVFNWTCFIFNYNNKSKHSVYFCIWVECLIIEILIDCIYIQWTVILSWKQINKKNVTRYFL